MKRTSAPSAGTTEMVASRKRAKAEDGSTIVDVEDEPEQMADDAEEGGKSQHDAEVADTETKSEQAEEAFQCNSCTKTYATAAKLRVHQYNHIQVKCDICSKIFKKVSLAVHLLTHQPKTHKCESCESSFATKKQLEVHCKGAHSSTSCGICARVLHMSSLRKHMRTAHGKDEEKHRCDVCFNIYASAESLQKHTAQYHAQHLQCDQCDYKTFSKIKLKLHQDTKHSDLRPFTCPNCGAGFKLNVQLKKHHDIVHSHLRPFGCSSCDARFTSKGNLQDHVSRRHSDVAEFECAKCDPVTMHKTLRTLKEHTRREHTEPATCNICAKTFRSHDHLSSHMRRLHGSMSGTCAICKNESAAVSKRFKDSSGQQHAVCHACWLSRPRNREETAVVAALKIGFDFPIDQFDTAIDDATCTRERPDIMYSAPGESVILVEIDENQHGGVSYSCEDARIGRLSENLKGRRIVVFRFNPHGYRTEPGETKVPLRERHNILIREMKRIVARSPAEVAASPMVELIYLFYTKSNDNITSVFPFSHVHV